MLLPLVNRGQELPVSRSAFKNLSMQKLTRKETWRSLGGFWGVFAELAEGWGSGGPENGSLLCRAWEAGPSREGFAVSVSLPSEMTAWRRLPLNSLLPCCFMHRPDSF